jgi:hypothetical protein
MFNRRSFFANCLGLASVAVLGKIPSDTVPYDYSHHISRVTIPPGGITVDMIRELGRRGPYYRYVQFPIEITESMNV